MESPKSPAANTSIEGILNMGNKDQAKIVASRKFGERIRKLRERRGFTRERFAELVGRHWSTIGRLERGGIPGAYTLDISVDSASRIAKALGVTIQSLLRGLKW